MSCLQTTTAEAISSLGVVTCEASWYAIQTRPRHEKKVAADLEEKGVATFLPLSAERRQWSDRYRVIHVPLFPRYVFVRIARSSDERVSVLRTLGVIEFVGMRGMGVPIPDSQIESIQTVVTREVPFSPHPFLTVGQQVRIREGSLDGLEGILTAVNGDQSLVVSIDIIQRSVAIRIAGYRIEAV
jgi:transcriptional antiterminator NusG